MSAGTKKKNSSKACHEPSSHNIRTVDSDGNALGESKAIVAKESGNLAEGAGLLVLSGGIASLGLDNLEVEIVGLRNGEDAGGAGVLLRGRKTSS